MKPFWVLARLFALSLVFSSATAARAAGEVVAAKPIDPQRYLGRWYEIARAPNGIQRDCQSATSDWSPKGSGQYDVVQTCRTGPAPDQAKIWRAVGEVLDRTAAKIRLGFFGGFVTKDYVVADRGDDYSWCILSTTSPRYVWIMSRRPMLDGAEKSSLIARAHELGFDVSNLVFDQPPPG